MDRAIEVNQILAVEIWILLLLDASETAEVGMLAGRSSQVLTAMTESMHGLRLSLRERYACISTLVSFVLFVSFACLRC